MSRRELLIRYLSGLLVLVLVLLGIAWLVYFAAHDDFPTGFRAFALTIVIPGFFMTIWWFAERKEVIRLNK